ncbi:MBL fold metallo-hydrolase [Longispora albida]|uniref:MBL fold metallo-hydrolase n=1 Tax=Longispora albida TaxID=203523 RepID=UPI000A05E16D|nr:MBL fold metallo-hydrolase [Longispora albida]
MRLTVAGCSAPAPSPESACSSFLVEHEGFRLLLDIGAGASGPLQKYVTPAEIDLVVVSHAHSDHWTDLTQLGHLRARHGLPPLRVVGSSELNPVVWTEPDVFEPAAAQPGELAAGPFTLRLAQVQHGGMECWATRVDDRLCYTADTEPCAAIDELADGCGVLLAEAAGFDAGGPMRGHLTAGDAGRLAKRSGARLLVLTGLRYWLDPNDILDEAASIADCPVVVAHPGLRVAL